MRRVIIAGMVGNMLEIYDMVIYGLLATSMSQNFFPQQDKISGIISIFAIFFIGYLARPIGAVFFGRMGDNFGRKPALLTSIGLMAGSTFILGILPNYHAVGLWATLLLLFVRLLQGFSCGGELIGSVIFVVEHAPHAHRGFYGSFSVAGANIGLLLATLVVWLLHHYFNELTIIEWAWRLPFLFGVLTGLVGWFVRLCISETQLFQESMRMPSYSLKLFRKYADYISKTVLIIGITLFPCMLLYLIYVFSVTYISGILHYSMQQALNINITSIILLVSLEPCMGKLSDRIGRRPVMIFALICSAIWIWPYFWLLEQHSMAIALVAQGVMTLFAAAYFPVKMVYMVEMVPVHLRFTVVAFAYAIAVSLFGGMTPFLASLLIKVTHSWTSLAFLLLICALISLFAIYKVFTGLDAYDKLTSLWVSQKMQQLQDGVD